MYFALHISSQACSGIDTGILNKNVFTCKLPANKKISTIQKQFPFLFVKELLSFSGHCLKMYYLDILRGLRYFLNSNCN